MRTIRSIGWLCTAFVLAFSFFPTTEAAITTRVVLTGGGDSKTCETIQNNLTSILNSADNLEKVRDLFDRSGYESFKELCETTGLTCVNVLYEPNLITLPGGGFEVRGIRVRVDMRNTKGNPDQYLVFSLNPQFLVTDARFAMENHHYERIVEDGNRLEDFAQRQQILQFIEIFRTAYNRKDIEYLKRAYSDDALIIVGRVLEVAPERGEMLEKSYLTRDQIQFVRLKKAEYMDNLQAVFKKNDFVNVDFDEIKVIRHDSIPVIYGVTLKQRWRSSAYSDEGYLFLMIDFADEDHPLIHVRTWQPEKFPDGSVISLYDFNII